MHEPGMTVEYADGNETQRGVVIASGIYWALIYLPGSEQHPYSPALPEAYRVVGRGDLVGGGAKPLAEADPSWLSWTWALIRSTGRAHLANDAVAREWSTAALLANGATLEPFHSLTPYSLARRWAYAQDDDERTYWREQYSRATGRRGSVALRELHAYSVIHRQS